ANRKSHWRKLCVELGERRDGVELQNLLGNRAGVFGIDVDRAGGERIEHDRRVTEALLMNSGCLSGSLCRLLQYLAQDVGFGKTLGTHVQRRRCPKAR